MNRYPHPDQLAALWQRVVEIGNETGRRPLIGLGRDPFHPENALALVALHRLARRPVGLIEPRFVVGGEGELWLLAAMQWRTRAGHALSTDGFNLVYAGKSLATYAASLTLNAPPASRGPMLSPGMAWMLTPTAVPGSERSDLEDLPFVLAEPLFVPVIAPPVAPDWLDRLETWGVLLLAVGLLLAAWLLPG